MKSFLPVWLKRLPWFLFKSPQRKAGLLKTYWVELRGMASGFLHSLSFRKQELQSVSICTGIKNRTDNYLEFVLGSILKMDHRDKIEISIFDCGSDDFEKLELSIRQTWEGALVLSSEPHPFERSYSFNKAIMQSHNPLIFAADADMSLPQDLVLQCNRYVSKYRVWFPVCFNLGKGKPAVIKPGNGEWRYSGKGMFASTKEQFLEIGKYDEKFKSWGNEDWDLWLRFYKNGFYPVRNRCKGLFHHYHEPVAGAGHN